MARYAYIRVSTDRQSYDQQIQDIKAYGINLDELDGITEEKMTTNRGYEDRAFNSLLKKCKSGDIIYAASTDRIGRDFYDMMKLMKEAANDGIEIIACKQNLSIARDDVATRIIVAITAIMDEDEKKRIQHRTANKKAWQREQIEKQGYFIIENGPNAGEKCYYEVPSKKTCRRLAKKHSPLCNKRQHLLIRRQRLNGLNSRKVMRGYALSSPKANPAPSFWKSLTSCMSPTQRTTAHEKASRCQRASSPNGAAK